MNRYFDFNATTPLCDAARAAWLSASEAHWHNPSSLYRDAGLTAQKLESARERLAALLGDVDAERIVFTGGATESNNALFHSLVSSLSSDARVAISSIEHPSVREAARAAFGKRVIEIPVNHDGIVEPDQVAQIVKENKPHLVSVMAANNESGAIQPWLEIAALCREAGVSFHTDAAQWLGKIDFPSDWVGDYITGSAHKFGGPKGVGFLVMRDEAEPLRFLRGGPQESGRRAGTENYPGVEAMVSALESFTPCLGEIGPMQAANRDAFALAMHEHFRDLRVISAGAERLWNTALMVMPRHDNLKWLTRLSRRGFSISTGSACSSGKEGSSVVVQALGATAEELRRVVRVSGGWQHTLEDWLDLAAAFVEVDAELSAGGPGRTVVP